MPILKTLTTPNGVAASFHKPTAAEISYRDAVAVVRVASWMSTYCARWRGVSCRPRASMR